MWKGGVKSYRQRALRELGCRCMNCNCPITKANIDIPEYMLDVHHRDGDRLNSKIENLEVVCVWCHAITTRSNWERVKAHVTRFDSEGQDMLPFR
jgi:hypothetical protein